MSDEGSKEDLSPRPSKESIDKQAQQTIQASEAAVVSFVNNVFNDNVPTSLVQRIEKLTLPESKVVDNSNFKNGNQITDTYAEAGRMGFYNTEADTLYLREGVSDKHIVIHEMLHFLSSYQNDHLDKLNLKKAMSDEDLSTEDRFQAMVRFGQLPASSFNRTLTPPNEALTEIITFIIEKNIDIHAPDALYKVYREVQSLHDTGEMRSDSAYQDWTVNFMQYLKERGYSKDVIPDMVKAYLLASQEQANKALKPQDGMFNKAAGKIFNPSLEELNEQTGVEATADKDVILLGFENIKDHLSQKLGGSTDLGRKVDSFVGMLQNGDDFVVEINHPLKDLLAKASKVEYIKIIPGSISEDAETRRPPRVVIDSRLKYLFSQNLGFDEDQEDYQQINTGLIYQEQAEAFLLWEAIKLDYYRGNNIVHDYGKNEFINEKTGEVVNLLFDSGALENAAFLDYLSELPISEVTAIFEMFQGVENQDFTRYGEKLLDLLELRERKGHRIEQDFVEVRTGEGEDRVTSEELDKILKENGCAPNNVWKIGKTILLVPHYDSSKLERLFS